MMHECFGLFKDLMSSIWTTNSNKQVVFRRQIGNDLSFSLTTVLTANHYVNVTGLVCRVGRQIAQCSRQNVFFGASICVYYYVRDISQRVNPRFSLVLTNLGVRWLALLSSDSFVISFC